MSKMSVLENKCTSVEDEIIAQFIHDNPNICDYTNKGMFASDVVNVIQRIASTYNSAMESKFKTVSSVKSIVENSQQYEIIQNMIGNDKKWIIREKSDMGHTTPEQTFCSMNSSPQEENDIYDESSSSLDLSGILDDVYDEKNNDEKNINEKNYTSDKIAEDDKKSSTPTNMGENNISNVPEKNSEVIKNDEKNTSINYGDDIDFDEKALMRAIHHAARHPEERAALIEKLGEDFPDDFDFDELWEDAPDSSEEEERRWKYSDECRYGEYWNSTLNFRIQGHCTPVDNYSKIPCQKIDPKTHELIMRPCKHKTGESIRLNEVPYLAIIDVDINHNSKEKMSDNDAQKLREQIIDTCRRNKYVLVQTPSGGFHIYGNTDDRWINKCCNKFFRLTGVKIKAGLELDVLTSMKTYNRYNILKINPIMTAGSKKKVEGEIREYQFLSGSYDSVLNYKIDSVLYSFGWMKKFDDFLDAKVEKMEYYEQNGGFRWEECPELDEDIEFQQILVDGLEGIEAEIHRTTTSCPVKERLSLLPLFQAINSLQPDLAEDAYYNIQTHCNLSDKALEIFDTKRDELEDEKSSLKQLCNILSWYNPNYYKETVWPALKRHKKSYARTFHIGDPFRWESFLKKAAAGKYARLANPDEDVQKNIKRKLSYAAYDLMRIFRYHAGGDHYFVENTLDDRDDEVFKATYLKPDVAERKLKKTFLFEEEIKENGRLKTKRFTALDAFEYKKTSFLFDNVRFKLKEEESKYAAMMNTKRNIEIFHGYKYKVLDKCDEEKISPYLSLIHDVIADGDEQLYEYILNWISHVVQYPGAKTETALILTGSQGTGKTTFTDILCELMKGYSATTEEVDELCGQYTTIIENKILLVLNEMACVRDKFMAQVTKLKSIITDSTKRAREIYGAWRTYDNVCNCIFTTNYEKPIPVDSDDRRYIYMRVSDRQKGNFSYFGNIKCIAEERAFYDNLLTFFMNRKINNFEPRDFPMTVLKQNIIASTRKPNDEWIIDNYDALKNGMAIEDVIEAYNKTETPDKMFTYRSKYTIYGDKSKWENFLLHLKNKCQHGECNCKGKCSGKCAKFQLKVIKVNGRSVRGYKLADAYYDEYDPRNNGYDEEVDEQAEVSDC